jgi:hypothetical protein
MKTPFQATINTERHFSVGTLSELWCYSPDTVTKMFCDVPGVLKIGTPAGRGKRPRITLRIPESIAAKVYAEKTR